MFRVIPDRMFDGPVGRDVAATLARGAPAKYEWSMIGEKNKVFCFLSGHHMLLNDEICRGRLFIPTSKTHTAICRKKLIVHEQNLEECSMIVLCPLLPTYPVSQYLYCSFPYLCHVEHSQDCLVYKWHLRFGEPSQCQCNSEQQHLGESISSAVYTRSRSLGFDPILATQYL